MSLSIEQLKHLANLAYLTVRANESEALANAINAVVTLIEELRSIDTTGIQPLLHPLDGTQPLRDDVAVACQDTETLAKIAPLFKDNLYLVPKVL